MPADVSDIPVPKHCGPFRLLAIVPCLPRHLKTSESMCLLGRAGQHRRRLNSLGSPSTNVMSFLRDGDDGLRESIVVTAG